MEIRTPNAAGYGNPMEQEINQVLEDMLDDYITIEQAKEVYGVVIKDDLTVDFEATRELRG